MRLGSFKKYGFRHTFLSKFTEPQPHFSFTFPPYFFQHFHCNVIVCTSNLDFKIRSPKGAQREYTKSFGLLCIEKNLLVIKTTGFFAILDQVGSEVVALALAPHNNNTGYIRLFHDEDVCTECVRVRVRVDTRATRVHNHICMP